LADLDMHRQHRIRIGPARYDIWHLKSEPAI